MVGGYFKACVRSAQLLRQCVRIEVLTNLHVAIPDRKQSSADSNSFVKCRFAPRCRFAFYKGNSIVSNSVMFVSGICTLLSQVGALPTVLPTSGVV